MSGQTRTSITTLQFIFLLFGIQVSFGFLTISRSLAEEAGTDGWLALPIGWLFSVIASLVIVRIMKMHPDEAAPQILRKYFGKWIGGLGTLALGAYFYFFAYNCLVYTVLLLNEWLLPETPAFIILFLMLVPTYLVAASGPQTLGRYAELVAYGSIWIPFVYLITLSEAHPLYLFPLVKEGWKPVIGAVPTTFYYFIGFAATFVFYPYLKDRKKAATAVIVSNSLTLAAQLFVTLICFAYFSPDEILVYNEPALSILKTIEFKFIERIEIPFLVLYLFVFSTSWIFTLHLGLFATSKLPRLPEYRMQLRIVMLLLAVASYFFIPTAYQNLKMNRFLGNAGLAVEYLFPLALLLWIGVRQLFAGRRNPG